MNSSLYGLVHVQLKSLIFYPRRSKTQGRPRSADLLINYQLPSSIPFLLSEHCTVWNCNFVLSPLGEWEQKSLQLLHNMLQFNSMCERCILKHLKHLWAQNIWLHTEFWIWEMSGTSLSTEHLITRFACNQWQQKFWVQILCFKLKTAKQNSAIII